MQTLTLSHNSKKLFPTIFMVFWSVLAFSQVNVEVEKASCNGKKDGKIDLTVSPGNDYYSFLWLYDNSTGDHLYDIPKGSYTVIITNKEDGCILEKSIEVGVENDKPKVDIPGDKKKSFCIQDEDKKAKLNAKVSKCEGCIIKWSNGEQSESIEVSSSGTYWVKVQDLDQCFDTDTAKVEIKTKDCEDGEEVDVPLQQSYDPNDILGPEGIGPQKWISVNDELPYKIRFENDPDLATAPAQKVVIRSPLSPNVDIFSLRLGSFGFGDFIFEVPENSTFYSTRLDVSDSLDVLVDLVAGVDVVKREAFWIFESVDPKTNLEPAAHLGFLLVNDTLTRRGEGFVNFTIRPHQQALTGDTIKARADIVFDINGSILTPEIFNTIDAIAPTSNHRVLASREDSVFNYAISAVDDFGVGGCGVKNYDLYISESNGRDYKLFASGIPIDSVIRIKGDPAKEYCVYTVSKDSVGNAEVKDRKDICFSPTVLPYVELEPASDTVFCQGEELEVNWKSHGIDTLNILISSDSGNSFKLLAANIPARHKSYYWEIPVDAGNEGDDYLIKIVDIKNDTLYDQSSKALTLLSHKPVKIATSNGSGFCEGDSTLLSLANSYSYIKWSNGSNSESIKAFESGMYKVEVESDNSCISKDSIQITVHSTPEKPQVLSPDNFKVCPEHNIVLYAPLEYESYSWSTSETAASIIVKDVGEYSVKVKDVNGCEAFSDTVTVSLQKDSICHITAIKNTMVNGEIKIEAYPNPLHESTLITFKLPTASYATLSVYNMQGLKIADIFDAKVIPGKEYFVKFKRNKDLKAGVYIGKLITDSGEEYSLKLVVN